MKYPPGFPEDLHPPVDQALAEAELRFRAGAKNTPDDDDNAFQGLALEFMKTTVAAFGRQACEAGRAGTWTGEDIRREVDEFVQRAVLYAAHELLPAAVGGDTDIPLWYEVKEELRRSEEWTTHLQERTQVARGQFAPDDRPRTSISLDSQEGRKAAVDAYIQEVLDETGLKITRKDIWEKVGYADASEFERWQRCDKRASRTAHERFTAVLREKPHLR